MGVAGAGAGAGAEAAEGCTTTTEEPAVLPPATEVAAQRTITVLGVNKPKVKPPKSISRNENLVVTEAMPLVHSDAFTSEAVRPAIKWNDIVCLLVPGAKFVRTVVV